MPTRRSLIAGSIAASFALPATLSAARGGPEATGEGVSVDRFPIWPKGPPGMPTPAVVEQWVKRSPNGGADDIAWPHVATPMLTLVKPAKPNGAAVLLCPGGGYARVAVGRTGGAIAREFAARGITAFELLYRDRKSVV